MCVGVRTSCREKRNWKRNGGRSSVCAMGIGSLEEQKQVEWGSSKKWGLALCLQEWGERKKKEKNEESLWEALEVGVWVEVLGVGEGRWRRKRREER